MLNPSQHANPQSKEWLFVSAKETECTPSAGGQTEHLPLSLSNFSGIRAVLNSFANPVILLDHEGRILVFNQQATAMLLRIGEKISTGDELAGKLPQHRQPVVREYIQRVLQGESLEYNILYPKGIWLLINLIPIIEEGTPRGVAVNFREASRKKKSNSGNKILSLLARESDKAVFITNKSQEIIWVNQQFSLTTGYSQKEIIGKTPRELFACSETDDRSIENINRHMQQGRYFTCEIFGRKANGKPYWQRLELQPILDEKKEATRYFNILSDCTEEKQRMEEKEVLSMVARETSNGVVILNKDNKVQWVNREFMRSTGFQQKEIEGMDAFALLAGPKTNADLLERIACDIANRKEFSEDLLLYTKDGQARWLHLQGKPLGCADQKGGRYFIIGRDITSRVKLEEERLLLSIDKQKAVVRAVLESKEEVKNRIGRELHDNINQLLAATKLQLQFGLSHPEKGQEILGKTIGYLQEAIDEIRNLSHELVMPRFGFETLVEAIEKLTGRHGITEHINLDLDGMKEELLNNDHKLTLYRIIQEQFSNILKHAHASQVWIELSNSHTHCYLTIRDNGIGCEKISKGDGIGIMNIRHRTELHQGSCRFYSLPGKGCHLEVMLKL